MKHIEKIEKEFDENFKRDHQELGYFNCNLLNDKTALGCNCILKEIKSFLLQSHTSLVQDLIKKMDEKRKEYDPDTNEFLFIDTVGVDAYNIALDNIISLLKEEI